MICLQNALLLLPVDFLQDLAAIDASMAELNSAFRAASAEMYAQSGAQPGAQQGANAGGQQQANQGGKEDIQDADFEEVK